MSRRNRPAKKKPIVARPVALSSRASFDVCSRCGMCCDGTVFNSGNLAPEETDHAVAVGLRVDRREDGQWAFEQPCPQFQGGCCAIYDETPSVCHSYQCRLLPEYAAGTMTLDDCLDVIEMMRSVTHRIEEMIGLPVGGFSAAELTRYMVAVRPQDDPDRFQPLFTAINRFGTLGRDYFGRNPAPIEKP